MPPPAAVEFVWKCSGSMEAEVSDDFLRRMSQFACLKMRTCDPKSEKSIEIVLEMRKVLGKEDP